ncbi:MAG: metallophosphoesterase [Candidatus Anstonellales archaeon]
MRYTADALSYINSLDENLRQSIEKRLKNRDLFIVDKELIENEVKIIEAVRKISEKDKETEVRVIRQSKIPKAKEYSPKVEPDKDRDITGKSRTRNTVKDFSRYFKSRIQRLSVFLKNKRHDYIDTTIKNAEKINDNISFIAIVTEKRETKNGNIIITAEDEEQEVTLIINKESEIFEDAKTIVPDEVLRFYCKPGKFFIVKDFDRPTYDHARWPLIESDVAIAYISDIHAGSKIMLSDLLIKFINNIRNPKDELAGKIKYVVIAGDLVDGIGIYPNQEQDLEIKDIYKQYEYLQAFLEQLPDYVEIIISPGNHDAVRRAEPSPAIDKKLLPIKAYFVGNPAYVDIEGICHLIYHGTSLDSLIANIKGLNYINVAEAMKEQLKRRHLSPIYGINPIVPEEFDYLVIDKIPNVYHAGHLHRTDISKYFSTFLVNSGTFQDRTAYQLKQGHLPTPGKIPILELKTMKFSLWDLHGDR